MPNLVKNYHSTSCVNDRFVVIDAEWPNDFQIPDADQVISDRIVKFGLEEKIIIERDSSLNGYRLILRESINLTIFEFIRFVKAMEFLTLHVNPRG